MESVVNTVLFMLMAFHAQAIINIYDNQKINKKYACNALRREMFSYLVFIICELLLLFHTIFENGKDYLIIGCGLCLLLLIFNIASFIIYRKEIKQNFGLEKIEIEIVGYSLFSIIMFNLLILCICVLLFSSINSEEFIKVIGGRSPSFVSGIICMLQLFITLILGCMEILIKNKKNKLRIKTDDDNGNILKSTNGELLFPCIIMLIFCFICLESGGLIIG